MNPPYSGLKLLFVAPVDDAELSHNAMLRRALERLGADVVHIDPDRIGFLERLVRRDIDQRIASMLEQHQPKVVLVAGRGVVPHAVVDQLRPRHHTRWVQLLGDTVSDLHAATIESMSYNDVFVGATGLVGAFDRSGVKHAHYLPVGCDPSVHKPLRARGPFRANVVFVGGATPRRERLLAELVEFGIALWGAGWRKTSLKDYCRGELPNTEDFVRAYAGATVAINVHRGGGEDRDGVATGLNRRTFEVAAIGVPQVVDARADLGRHFEEGSELLVYSDGEQLRGQVKRAIQEDKYRDRLAQAARKRALSQHTYMHRMHDLLRAVAP